MTKYTLIFIILAFGFNAKGQRDSTLVISLQQVVVTALRNPEEATLIPYSVNSITGKTLDDFNPRTTPEALMNMNGVFVQKTNHGGGSPFIRGLTGNQALLLIDGIRLNNSIYRYGPNQYLNTIDAFNVDKIELAKGTGSVQYGTDALGGVLQVFTTEPLLNQARPSLHGKVFGKYMTGDMEKSTRSEFEYSSPKCAALIGATYRDFGDIIGGKSTGKQSPSGYNEHAFDAKIIAELKKNIHLTIASQFLRQQHVPIYHKVKLENYLLSEFDPQQRILNYARLNIKGHKKQLNQIRIIASWQQGMEGRNSQKNGRDLLISEKDKVNTLGFTTNINSTLSKRWNANSGIEIYRDKVGSTRDEINTSGTGTSISKRGLYPDDSKSANYSMYTLHHFNIGKWIIDGGIRFNVFKIKISDVTVGDVEISPEAAVMNGAVMYNFNHAHHIYTNLSQGFRAPNIDDLGSLGIVDFRYEVPAFDLSPEKSQNIELGYKFNTGKIHGTVAGYYMNLNQLITRVKIEGELIDGYQVYKKQNVEKAFIQGFEADISWQVWRRLEINSGISYTYGQSITGKEPLRRIPPFNGRLAGTYKFRSFLGVAEFLFASKQGRLSRGDISDNRIPAGGTPGWQVVNLYAGYQIASVKLNIGFQNIFDEDYRMHGSGINGIGKSIMLTVNYLF